MKLRITLLTKTASTMLVYVPKPTNNLFSMLNQLANVHIGRGYQVHTKKMTAIFHQAHFLVLKIMMTP